MYISTKVQYDAVVAALESVGFSAFPPSSEIDFTVDIPARINVSMQHAKTTVVQTGDLIQPNTP